jgi:hypothetical protein
MPAECTNHSPTGLDPVDSRPGLGSQERSERWKTRRAGSSTNPHSLWMNPSDEGCEQLWKN